MDSKGILRYKDTAAALRAKYGAAYGVQKNIQPISDEQRAEIERRELEAAAARSRSVMAHMRKR